MKKIILILIFLFSPLFCFAQDEAKTVNIKEENKRISQGQIDIFMKFVEEKDFNGIKKNGYEVFVRGNVLPENYKEMFLQYLTSEESGIVTYTFYNAQSQYSVANVSLTVNSKEETVVSFSAVEAELSGGNV